MVANPPANMTRIVPNVFYDDPAAALEWLGKAFSFEKRMAMPGPDGAIIHAEMQVADGVFMMTPSAAAECFTSPQTLGAKVTQGLYIYVDDVNAHCERARKSGAKILAEPEDMFWGDRTYIAADPEGHRWTFAQAVREVKPEDMKPPG